MEYKWLFNGIFLYLSVLYLVGLFSGMQLNVINVACVAISGGGFSAGQIGAAKTFYEKFHMGACIFYASLIFLLIFLEPNCDIPSWSGLILFIAILINVLSLI